MSDRLAAMTFGEKAEQAATSGEYELTTFTIFSCIRFVVHPSAL